MIKIENVTLAGFEAAFRGMRNPKNSWNKADSNFSTKMDVGPNDMDLALRLAKGGPVHAKYRRMIEVWVDITAPLYWWKEFDTYKVGTVANSCSTMHKIADKEFEWDDFSFEHYKELGGKLYGYGTWENGERPFTSGDMEYLYGEILKVLNTCRDLYLKTHDKSYWWQMIQLLPSSYNQKRTVMLSYEVLHNMYTSRKDHKLDEWHTFCDWIKTLPLAELITQEES